MKTACEIKIIETQRNVIWEKNLVKNIIVQWINLGFLFDMGNKWT